MRTADRELPAVMAELEAAITTGREPQLSDSEWAAVTSYVRRKGKPDRRGHSFKRHCQGADRRMLRMLMERIKFKLRRDPTERKLKHDTRRNGGTYILNHRVAKVMHERLKKSGRNNIPSVQALENILSRPYTKDELEEPW